MKNDLRQIDVDLEFDSDDQPSFFVTEDGKMKFPYAKVEMAEWKNILKQADAFVEVATRMKENDEVVILFDGSDTIIYALMSDCIQV